MNKYHLFNDIMKLILIDTDIVGHTNDNIPDYGSNSINDDIIQKLNKIVESLFPRFSNNHMQGSADN